MNQTTKTTSIGCLGISMKLFIDLLLHILGNNLFIIINYYIFGFRFFKQSFIFIFESWTLPGK